jgi:hypothetical protein
MLKIRANVQTQGEPVIRMNILNYQRRMIDNNRSYRLKSNQIWMLQQNLYKWRIMKTQTNRYNTFRVGYENAFRSWLCKQNDHDGAQAWQLMAIRGRIPSITKPVSLDLKTSNVEFYR